jgi:hypothetical protein
MFRMGAYMYPAKNGGREKTYLDPSKTTSRRRLMKRLTFGLGFVCFLAVLVLAPETVLAGNSDWEWMNPLPQGNPLNGVWGISATDVFAVGDAGTILHYDGTDWSAMSSGTTASLNGVWGSSAADVFAIGDDGTILHYDGTSWSAMTSNTAWTLFGVWGSSASDVFAVGGSGTIVHYDGTSWSDITSGTTEWLFGVWGSSSTNVFAVGTGGAILHYDGTDWSIMSSGTMDYLNSVWGSSATDVFAVGDGGTILHYDGTDWSAMSGGTTQFLDRVWGSSASDVFALGGTGTILHYDGTSWSNMVSETFASLFDVWGSSSTDVFAVGDDGTTLHYDGTGWSAMTSGTTRDLFDAWGSSASDVFVVGGFGTILRYDGTSWTSMTSGTGNWLFAVWGSSSTDVFAVGGPGTIIHYDGTDWSAMSSGTTAPPYGVWGSSATDVFTVGSSGTILHYNGTNWSAMSSGTAQTLTGIWGSSATDVFAVGFSGTILHYDGTSWSAMSSGTTQYLNAVWGSSATDVYAVGDGGTILHYDGTSWSAMSSGTMKSLNGVWGNSATDVFAVGTEGAILHYNGTNWSALSSGTKQTLKGVLGSSATDVYAVGDGGAILHYSPTAVAPTVTTKAATGITSSSATLNMSYTMGSYDDLRVCYAYKKVSDSEWTDTGFVPKSTSGDYSEAITALESNTLYEFKALLLYSITLIDGGTLQFTTSSVLSPAIGLSRDNLHFGYEIGGTTPSPQQVLITNTGGGTLDWTAAANSWLGVSPASGTGDAMIAVSVDATGLAAGTYTSQVTVEAAGATNSPQMIDVTLNVIAAGASSPPFGYFDTPTAGATVAGAIPVTGWALDDVEVVKIDVKRSPHATDNPAAIGPDGLVYIGDAIFVEGARPDIEATYPDYPLNYRAGWGYMMLTNMLPDGGNGAFTLHAFATDKDGNRVKLGEKAVTSDNANSKLPFGTIDTPSQGGGASGAAYYNFGWALTPKPNMIPIDGSTIWVFVDGVGLGNPSYNHYRDDIATLFPDYLNSGGAVGVYDLNTTAYANGMHTIAWGVTDNVGNADGIGSRYFMVQNMGGAEIEGDSRRPDPMASGGRFRKLQPFRRPSMSRSM